MWYKLFVCREVVNPAWTRMRAGRFRESKEIRSKTVRGWKEGVGVIIGSFSGCKTGLEFGDVVE